MGSDSYMSEGELPTVYTIGHSTRSADELLALLEEAGVKLLADVRAFPSSRRHPQFNGPVLTDYLRAAGISYRHMPRLGGRRSPVPGSPNGGWHETAFQGYADHMATTGFQRALAALEAAARNTPTAIMCAEAVWWRCHRRLIADALVVRGWRVEHLGIGEGRAEHELTGFAVVGPDYALTYPPAQGRLAGLASSGTDDAIGGGADQLGPRSRERRRHEQPCQAEVRSMEASEEEFGPIDVVVIGAPAGAPMTGEAIPILLDLVDRGIIRVLDARYVRKDADGTFSGFDFADLDGDEVGDLTVFAGATTGLLGDDDVAAVAAEIEPGTAAVMIVYENRWAAQFATAVRRNGGVLVAFHRVGVQELIDALEAADAAETAA
jgi:uncharacterized protein DUF488/uncharacterized protein DUF6325